MKTQTPIKQTAHRLAAVLAIALAFATTSAWAWDKYYWTGATSTDYHTAANWNSNHVAVATDIPHWRWGIDQHYETADIVSYRIDIAQNAYGRGGWVINAGTEAQPLEFYCAKGSTTVSPDSSTYNYASGLTVASTCDSWVWINGGKWDEFAGNVTIGSSDYAGHFLIGNARGVDTLFKTTGNVTLNQGSVAVSNATVDIGGNFTFNQGSVAVSNATVNIGGQLIVGNTADKLTSFDFYNSTMVISNYFSVKNSAIFDLCGGSITNAAQYLTVDASGEMTIRNGGRYACQAMFIVGNYSAGTLNIIDGGEAASGTRLSLGYRSGSSGTVNIASGGILTVPYIHLYDNEGSATVALDGGTIRAAKDGQTLIQAKANLHVTVGANGGTIDAAGYNVTIAEDLDNASGETGAMTFKGGGTVTLSGAINYTGGTTVEAGTVVVVPSVAKRTALGTITVTGLENTICEVVRLSGEGTFSAGDLPADTETVTFAVSSDGKSILAASGLEGPFWIGGSGDLSAASNWSGGVVPTENPTIKWSTPITLTNSGNFAPDTLTIPDDSAVVTLAGALTVNCLTNASRLAVASTGSLTVTGDLVATVESNGGSRTFLHSNEGTVTVGGKAIGYTNVGGFPDVFEYAAVTENTRPIQARGIAYQCGGSGQLGMKLQSSGNTAGSWVVGADGFSFPNCRNANYTTFFAESAAVTLYSADNWTLANSKRYNTTRGDLYVSNASGSSLVIDTSDYVTPATRRTVTLKGRIVAYNPVTIKGCGTVVVDTTGSNTSVFEDFQHTCLTNAATLSVTDTATLQINAGKKITGNGTISLAAGTTLALKSTGREFAAPDIVPVTLPAEGAATICIDGERLKSGEDFTVCSLTDLPDGYVLKDHLNITGTALNGRRYEVKAVEVTENETTVTKLVANIQSAGLMLIFR